MRMFYQILLIHTHVYVCKLELYNLVEGIYKFKLIVTDNEGATATDYISIIVNGEEKSTVSFEVTAE